MAEHLKRSRVLKALTDATRVSSFPQAEARLDAVRLNVVVGRDQLRTPAGQAAALTAVATAHKCFGRVTLVASDDAPLIASVPLGHTLLKAARRLGARIATNPTGNATHVVRIGDIPKPSVWSVRCWWDGWLTGVRAFDMGDSRLALAGVFSGAAAVRQVFACVLAGRDLPGREASLSLWTPWEPVDLTVRGPDLFDVPDKLWFLGLGHLGQALVWNLSFLGGSGNRLAILQDDQSIGEENEATSLLVLPGSPLGEHKVRIAANWLETAGWGTQLIERRHYGDIAITDYDPPYLLSGVDDLEPRRKLARHGFPFMLDTGIGHGAGDFEGIQIRTIAKGQSLDGLWEEPSKARNEERAKKLLDRPAYQKLDRCGALALAEASVAVPFVGAAAAALTIAQASRLASLQPTPHLMQVELGAPELVTNGGLAPGPETNLGSFSIRL